MELKIKLLSAEAKMPVRMTPGSAGLDVFIPEDYWIPQGKWARVNLELALEPPEGWCALIMGRSGLMKAKGIVGQLGLIDSDYRGEIGMVIMNHGPNHCLLKKGQRVGQLLLIPKPMFTLRKVMKLSDTERGSKGFGSTGK